MKERKCRGGHCRDHGAPPGHWHRALADARPLDGGCVGPHQAKARSCEHTVRCGSLSPVRGASKKNEKRKRAEAVEGPSPGGVWGGNRRVY